MDKKESYDIGEKSLEKFAKLAEQLKEKDVLKFNRMLGRLEGMVENESTNKTDKITNS